MQTEYTLNKLHKLEVEIDKENDIILQDLFKPLWLYISFFIIGIFLLIKKGNHRKIITDFQDPFMIVVLFYLILVSYWAIYIQKNHRILIAAERAITGCLIGYLASIDLVFMIYLVIFSFSYNIRHAF